jgi:predicted alpha/beta superfamily hydrolase
MNLYIKLPLTYHTNPQKMYQTWYFTDANRFFPMVANLISIFDLPRPVEPEIVAVGIGYKINDMADMVAWRTRDLTPTNATDVDTYWNKKIAEMTDGKYEVKSGGAEAFLNCIVKEVIPFIESNYRVSNINRGLGGYSYGGLFSLYVLFRQPELFLYYHAGSVPLSYDNGVIFDYEKDYSSSHKDLNANLFMSVGGEEDPLVIAYVKKMADLLKSRNYPGLTVESQVFPGETHQSCIPSSFTRALRVLYKR